MSRHALLCACTQAKPTEAIYTLKDPAEVQAFLSKIISWGHTPANAWHQKQSCTGWALDPSVGPPLTNGYLSLNDNGELPESGRFPSLEN